MTGTELVVLSLEPWDEVWRRNQYLVDGLLRTDPELRVLFVEPANDLLHSLLSGRGVRRGRGLRAADGYQGRLRLFQPDKVLPRMLGSAADALLRRSLRAALRRSGLRHPLIWVNDPSWAGLVAGGAGPALYDITDDWLRADRPERELRRIRDNEDVLMARCAAVVVCSADLAASRGRVREVVQIPNAVDVRRYREPQPRPADLPHAPTAVYVGTLHEDRLDTALILRTADALAAVDGAVVLVGPNALGEANSRMLTSHGRVRVLGPRPWQEIPAYLQHATALIVPHVVSGFTDSLDPIKLYEYRAAGRPVVSTPVAGFRTLPDDAAVIAGADDFPAAVVAALRADAPNAAASDVPDWADRVAQLARVLRGLTG